MALILVAALAGGAPLAAQSRIVTEVDTTLVTVGDRITLAVTVEHPAGARVVWPDSIALSPFEVLDARLLPPSTGGEAARSTALLTLTAFELGELEIPSFEVTVEGPGGTSEVLSTDRFGVEVVSVGADESGDIRDIRGPLGIPVSAVRVSLWVLALLLAAAAAWLLLRRVRRGKGERTVESAAPTRPPWETALGALAELQKSPLLERGQVKEYHIRLSEIVRTWVEARFGVASLEMTTAEVLFSLRRAGVDPVHRERLEAILRPSDMVKFAKVRPNAASSREVLEAARRFVEGSIPEPEPVAPSEDEPPAPSEDDPRAPVAASGGDEASAEAANRSARESAVAAAPEPPPAGEP